MNENDFAAQFKRGPATSAAQVLAWANVPDLADVQEEQAARAAADARIEERETLAMLNQRAGDPIGNVSRCQAAVSEVRLKVADLENQLETARGLLSRATGELGEWSAAVDEITATASRSSNVPVDPMQRAQEVAHAAFVESTRAMWAAPASSPKALTVAGVSRSSAAGDKCTGPDCPTCTAYSEMTR